MKAVFITPTDRLARWLRRYENTGEIPLNQHLHQNWVRIEDGQVVRNESGRLCSVPMVDHADPRWPVQCEKCNYRFVDADEWQVFTDVIYSNGLPLREAPEGSLWYADWLNEWHAGPDGRCLMAKCPGGGIWNIDGRASNCTMPNDKVHRCWVRHGSPALGELVTVDKNGHTCQAGGGSIQTHNWHGHLRNGEFVL